MKISDKAIGEYREALKAFWDLSEKHAEIMPHPVSFHSSAKPPYTFQQWDSIRDLVVGPARYRLAELEEEYPGIAEEYEERRYQYCDAQEATRFEDNYR